MQLGKMLQPARGVETDVEVRYLNAGSLSNIDSLDALPSMFVSKQEITRYEVRTGDLVVAEGGDVGRAAFLPELPSGVIIQNSLHRIRTLGADLRYVKHCLDSVYSSGWLEVLCNKSTFGHLTKEKLTSLPIPLHSNLQQRAIADYLDAETARIDAIVATKGVLIEKLREKRSALISNVFRRGLPPEVARAADLDPYSRLKPTGVEWLGQIPEHWEVGRIKFFARIESGHTPNRSVDEYWVDCTIPWVSLNDSGYLRTHDYISDTAFMINELGLANSSARLLPAGVVVFSRDATVGLCAITTRPMAVSQHFIAYVCGPRLHPAYLLLVLKAMGQHLESLSLGATIATIGMDDIRSLTCPLPPIPEQRAITGYLERESATIDLLVAKIETAIERLQEYRAALITSAVTGELDIPGLAA